MSSNTASFLLFFYGQQIFVSGYKFSTSTQTCKGHSTSTCTKVVAFGDVGQAIAAMFYSLPVQVAVQSSYK